MSNRACGKSQKNRRTFSLECTFALRYLPKSFSSSTDKALSAVSFERDISAMIGSMALIMVSRISSEISAARRYSVVVVWCSTACGYCSVL